MVRGWGIAFLFSFFCFQSFAKPSADRFREYYDDYLAGESRPLDDSFLSQFDYLFFAGFAGVKFKPLSFVGDGYFDTFRQEVRRHGVSQSQVPSTIYPPSSKTIAENGRDFLNKILEARVAEHGRKLVLFGHSKGAVELFHWAVTHPEFVREHVEALIFVSGAFQGSALANLVKGKPNRIVPMHIRVPSTLVASALAPYLNFFWKSGLESLTSEAASEHLSSLLSSEETAVKLALDKSLFIQTATKGVDRSPFIWLPDCYLRSEGNQASDGLVTVSAQLPMEEVPESVLLEGGQPLRAVSQTYLLAFFQSYSASTRLGCTGRATLDYKVSLAFSMV